MSERKRLEDIAHVRGYRIDEDIQDLTEIIKLCKDLAKVDPKKAADTFKKFGITINTKTLLPQIKSLHNAVLRHVPKY